MIYFTQTAVALSRVSADLGGAPELVLPLDQGAGHRRGGPEDTRAQAEGVVRLAWAALPEGKAVLFTVQHDDRFDSFLYEIESRESRVLVEGATNARYAGSGHLVVSRDGSLEAIPFDLENLEVTGPVRSVVERVAMIGGLAGGRPRSVVGAAFRPIEADLVFHEMECSYTLFMATSCVPSLPERIEFSF